MQTPLWRDLEPGTKWVLGTGLMFLVAVLIYLVIEPFVVERHRLTAEIPRLREDLAWMKAHVSEIQRLRLSGDSGSGLHEEILAPAVVEQLIRNSGLQDQVTDMKPGTNGDVVITFKEVSYKKLMTFLFDLNKRNSAYINQARVNRLQDKTGMVSARLSLGFVQQP